MTFLVNEASSINNNDEKKIESDVEPVESEIDVIRFGEYSKLF